MKIRTVWLAALVALLSAFAVFAETRSKAELVQTAVSADPAAAAEAVRNLRALGKDGLDALFQTYGSEIAKFSRDGEVTDEWKRLALALDSVAMQKDAYASQLFWFTDLEEAKREAVKRNKPILSLRQMISLGNKPSNASLNIHLV